LIGIRPRFVVSAVVCGALVGAYVLSNIYFFGGAMPISGWLKGNFPQPFFKGLEYFGLSQINRASLGGYSLLLGWAPLLIGVIVLAFMRPKEPKQLAIALLLLAGGATQGAYIAVYTRSSTMWPWYYVLPIVLLAVTLAILVERFQRFHARAIVLAAISIVVIAAYIEKYNLGDTPAFKTIDYLKRHGVSGETVLVSDWPGAVAFYTDNNVLAADMLTSNRIDFEKMRSESNALEYLISVCQQLQKPIKQVLLVGNTWLVWDKDAGQLIYYDPRRYPVLVPIGTLPTRASDDGGAICDDGIPVGIVMEGAKEDAAAAAAHPER
jgi:hypothetical protein